MNPRNARSAELFYMTPIADRPKYNAFPWRIPWGLFHPSFVDDIHYLTWSPLLQIRAELKNTFASGRTKSIIWRQKQLLQLAHLVQGNADTLAEAISKDLGKPRFEVFLSEINLVTQRSIMYAKEIGEWTKDEDMSPFNEDWQGGWTQKVRKEPKGVVLIIAYALLLPITDFSLPVPFI